MVTGYKIHVQGHSSREVVSASVKLAAGSYLEVTSPIEGVRFKLRSTRDFDGEAWVLEV